MSFRGEESVLKLENYFSNVLTSNTVSLANSSFILCDWTIIKLASVAAFLSFVFLRRVSRTFSATPQGHVKVITWLAF